MSREQHGPDLAGAGLIVLAAACFGTLGPLSRFAFEAGVGSLVLVTWRAGLGAACMLLFLVLRHATGSARPGHPLGNICPVATSATLGQDEAAPSTTADTVLESADPTSGIREVAATVFGTHFGPDSVVGEDRLGLDEFMDALDYELPVPHPVRVANLPDPHTGWNGARSRRLGAAMLNAIWRHLAA